MRRVAEEPSPSPSCAPYRDDARKRFRFHSLSQDYTEFLEETEEKKRRLLEARLMKHKLLAEVRFLRRKLETLFANPYQQVRLKEPSSTTPVIKPPTEKKSKVSEAARTIFGFVHPKGSPPSKHDDNGSCQWYCNARCK